jgi:hypothetical protein
MHVVVPPTKLSNEQMVPPLTVSTREAEEVLATGVPFSTGPKLTVKVTFWPSYTEPVGTEETDAVVFAGPTICEPDAAVLPA